MKFLLMTLFLFSTKVHSRYFNPTSEGSGLERLMEGAGMARTGSTGSVANNPSLLAWLPQEKEFFTSNAYTLYKFGNPKVKHTRPEIVPIYAVTTEGKSNWGHGYGVTVNKFKLSLADETDEIKLGITVLSEIVTLTYGFGVKIGKNLAFGVSTYVGSITMDQEIEVLYSFGGYDSLQFQEKTFQTYANGYTLGVTQLFDRWAWAVSARFNAFKFGSTASNKETLYNESTNETVVTKNQKVAPTVIVPVLGFGLARTLSDDSNLYFDVNYTPSKTDPEEEKRYYSYTEYRLGLETKIMDKEYGFFSGLLFSPKKVISNEIDKEATGGISCGFSSKREHSMNFFGVSWRREIEFAANETISFNFGTSFDY